MQLYLNDSFMIRKIIVAAVPAALVAVGMSIAVSEPANACMGKQLGGTGGGCMIGGFRFTAGGPNPSGFSNGGGFHIDDSRGTNTNTTSNTNQVYPNTNSKPAGMGF